MAFASDVWARVKRWQSTRYGPTRMGMERAHLYLKNKNFQISKLEANENYRGIEGAILDADGLTLVIVPFSQSGHEAEGALWLRDIVDHYNGKLQAMMATSGLILELADRLRRDPTVAAEKDIKALAGFVLEAAAPTFTPLDYEPGHESFANRGFRLGRIGDSKKYCVLEGVISEDNDLKRGPYTGLMIVVPPTDHGLDTAADYLDKYIFFSTPRIDDRHISPEQLSELNEHLQYVEYTGWTPEIDAVFDAFIKNSTKVKK